MQLQGLLVSLIEASGKKSFLNDHRKLGSFFYNAYKNPKTSDLFENVFFIDTLGYPSSNQLDDAIRLLQLTGVIGRPNPIYLTNTINLTHVDVDRIPFTSPEEKQKFVHLLNAFKKELCHDGE